MLVEPYYVGKAFLGSSSCILYGFSPRNHAFQLKGNSQTWKFFQLHTNCLEIFNVRYVKAIWSPDILFWSWCSKAFCWKMTELCRSFEILVCIAKWRLWGITHTHTHPSNQKSFAFKINNRSFSCWLSEESIGLPQYLLGRLPQKLCRIGSLAKCSWVEMRKQQVQSIH